ACGLPAVAVRASGVDEVVTDGQTGILTKAETGEMADAAIGLLLDARRRAGSWRAASRRPARPPRWSRTTKPFSFGGSDGAAGRPQPAGRIPERLGSAHRRARAPGAALVGPPRADAAAGARVLPGGALHPAGPHQPRGLRRPAHARDHGPLPRAPGLAGAAGGGELSARRESMIWNRDAETASRATMRALQTERLRATVARARARVPFYRED